MAPFPLQNAANSRRYENQTRTRLDCLLAMDVAAQVLSEVDAVGVWKTYHQDPTTTRASARCCR